MSIELDPMSEEHHHIWWPLAPGEWWSPNFAADKSTPKCCRHEWSPGDLVVINVNPQTHLLKKARDNKGNNKRSMELQGPPYLYRITVWGGDDDYVDMSPDVMWTAQQVKEFFWRLPNPLTRKWLNDIGFKMH